MSLLVGAERVPARNQNNAINEEALVAQCRTQDFEAFGRLVDAYQNRVYGFVRRMLRNDEEALDVTQEVFIKAYQGMAGFDGRASLRSWLFRIAYNLCVDRARKVSRQVKTLSYEPNEEGDEPMEFSDRSWDPSESLLANELQGIMEEAIASMSDKLRTVLLMHDKEEMGYDEIAQAMEIPVGTVKSRLFLARNHVKERIERYMQEGL
ncbi:MAG: sigma-70 family RNA polymerase sigma factor [Fimbriimonadaceae bacterium]|nr:sigma-70 family RNA polymerase sigma factor [Armatimonadota bacterium]